MSLTASNIVDLSVNTTKFWDGDDPQPAFNDSIFCTYNWNCAAMSIIRNFCDQLFDDLADQDDYNDPDAWLKGDLYDNRCWFDWEANQANFACHINGYDTLGFHFQEHTFVFFIGKTHSYMIQWYKSRGRTEWVLKMEGVEMATARPVMASEYAELINDVVTQKKEPCTHSHDIEYNFWWIDELECQENERYEQINS